jgi:hypothetical protein
MFVFNPVARFLKTLFDRSGMVFSPGKGDFVLLKTLEPDSCLNRDRLLGEVRKVIETKGGFLIVYTFDFNARIVSFQSPINPKDRRVLPSEVRPLTKTERRLVADSLR